MDFTVPGILGALHGSSLTCDSYASGDENHAATFPRSWVPIIPTDVERDGAFVTWRSADATDATVKGNTIFGFDPAQARHAVIYKIPLNGPGAKVKYGDAEDRYCYAAVLHSLEGARCYSPCGAGNEAVQKIYVFTAGGIPYLDTSELPILPWKRMKPRAARTECPVDDLEAQMEATDTCLAKQTVVVPWSEGISSLGISDQRTFLLTVDEISLVDRHWRRVLRRVGLPVVYLFALFAPYLVSNSFPSLSPRIVGTCTDGSLPDGQGCVRTVPLVFVPLSGTAVMARRDRKRDILYIIVPYLVNIYLYLLVQLVLVV